MVCAFAVEQIARPTSNANSLCIFFPFLKGEQAGNLKGGSGTSARQLLLFPALAYLTTVSFVLPLLSAMIRHMGRTRRR